MENIKLTEIIGVSEPKLGKFFEHETKCIVPDRKKMIINVICEKKFLNVVL